MPDPLQDANAGQPSPFVTKLDTVNGVLEAARDWRQRRLGSLQGAAENNPSDPACYCWVRNDTGSSLSAHSVVTLGTPVISAVDYPHNVNRTPVFPGTAPAAATDVFAITLEPASTSAIVRAVVLGLVVVDLNVTDAAHTHAVPVAATTATMDSATSGPARIVWKETGTGTKRAVVCITEQQEAEPPPTYYKSTSTLSHTITADGTWQDVANSEMILPVGKFSIFMNAGASGEVNTILSSYVLPYIAVRLVNAAGTEILRTRPLGLETNTLSGASYAVGSSSATRTYSNPSITTVKMQAYRHSGCTWVDSLVNSSDNGDTRWGWVELTNGEEYFHDFDDIVWDTAGSHSDSVPAGATFVRTHCWGGGGAGGAQSSVSGGSDGCGGGGGGAYALGAWRPVSSGDPLIGTVGAGGVGETGSIGTPQDGAATNANTGTVVAAGGKGGEQAGIGGAGGAVVDCTGVTKYAGGAGATVTGAGAMGGGGGGAGSSAAGSAGSGSTGGAGGTGTYAGGAGGGGANPGVDGTAPGGGGGGKCANDVVTTAGDGAVGKIVFEFA